MNSEDVISKIRDRSSAMREVRTPEMWHALKKRKTYTEEFKRQLVAETKEEGKSVAMVAWLHYLKAPQLHKWVKAFGVEV